MTYETGCEGYQPIIEVRPDERAIYEQMWKRPEYRIVAPGESVVLDFLQQAKIKPGEEVIDFGAGTGRGALALRKVGAKVRMLDFAANCLDDEVRAAQCDDFTFQQHDLTKPVPVSAQYGYCTDVMEHIPPQHVVQVLQNILLAARHVFFQIACEPDVLGQIIGQPLHLTVENHDWWLKKFTDMDCIVHWSKDCGSHCMFYVTAWRDGQEIVDGGELNNSQEQIKANVVHNIQQGWRQAEPHQTQETEVMILGGGWSLDAHEDQIRKLRADGVKLVTLNGAYNWCLERGLTPSATILVDSRPFNKRFVEPVVDDCIYMICSQCDPSVYDGLPRERTIQWHSTWDYLRDELNRYLDRWYSIPGGSTVLLRAIPLLRMLGFYKFHLFGCDSCMSPEGTHHAYKQEENDGGMVLPINYGSRTFYGNAWMVGQAQEFISMVKHMGDMMELEIYGDGLLRHIVETGASLNTDDEGAGQWPQALGKSSPGPSD